MEISEYFSSVWKGDIEKYKYSGKALVDKVEWGDRVLDVGCGYNYFSDKIPLVTGIDPYNDSADIKVSIEDFDCAVPYDKIFCLGSINFGEYQTIQNQIGKVVSLLKPGGTIYWRQNPGLADHGNQECKDIPFFEWSFEHNLHFAKLAGCEVSMLAWDTDNRIYAEWIKNETA